MNTTRNSATAQQDRELLTLRVAGVTLIDCDHRTPPAASGGYPYVAIPQIKNGRLDLTDVRRITPEHFAQWTKKAKPQANDVVLSRRCNPGETAYVPPHLEFALGQNLVLLRSDGSRIFPPFLRWLLRGLEWWEQIGRFINVGAVFDSLKCADIPNFELTIPPLREQERIADILGSLDEKIELNRRMNETLEAMARVLFESWFVDFLPVHAKAAVHREHPNWSNAQISKAALPNLASDITELFPDHFEGSDPGRIPAGWRTGPLSEIAAVIMGTSPPGDTYNEEGIGEPLVNGPVEFGDRFPVKKKWTTAPTRLSKEGDLIFCVRGSTTGRRITSDGVYCLGRGVCSIRSSNGCQPFVTQTVDAGLERLLSKTSGSVFPNLNGPDIKNFEILLPPESVVQQYCIITQPLIEQVKRNCERSRNLAVARDSLLPRLLSGELCVANTTPRVETAHE